MKKYYYEGPTFKIWRGSWDPTFKFWRGSWCPTFKLWGGSRVPGSRGLVPRLHHATLVQVFSCEFCEICVCERERERERDTERERERDLRLQLQTEIVLQYLTLMWSSARDHSIDISDNIYGWLSALTCRYSFKIMNFSDRFRQCFKLFYSFEK